ncbi:MAG: hypothetical protein IJ642_03585 [Oscillospiraceae bacterium]|nr:hypothetical protein [Oscillospiraceae bacterium]
MSQQREKDIFEFIRNYIRRNKIAPSVREICEGLGIRSTSTVHRYLHRLEEEGKLQMSSGKNRAIFIKETISQGIPVISQIQPGTELLDEKNIQSYYRPGTMQALPASAFAFRAGKDYPEYSILKEDMLIAETAFEPETNRLSVFLTQEGLPAVTAETLSDDVFLKGNVIMIIRNFE